MYGNNKRSIWHMCIVFIGVAAFFGLYTCINFDTYEDSIWLKPALDLLQGKVLFREIFTPYGMFVPFAQAAVMRLFGPYLLVLRIQAALCYAITALFLFAIWQKFLSVRLSYVAILLWLVLAPIYTHILLPWASIHALVFQSMVLWSVLRYIETPRRRYLIIAGSATVLTFFARQSVGVFLAFAVSLWIVAVAVKKKQFSMLVDTAIGVVATVLPFVFYLVLQRALADWWVQSFVFTREYARVIRGISLEQVGKSLLVGSSWKYHTYHLTLIWVLIPLSSFYYLVRPMQRIFHTHWSQKTQRFLIVALVCLTSWMQYYPMAEPVHFFWAITPTIGFFVSIIIDVFRLKNNKLLGLFATGLLTLFLMLITVQLYASIPRFVQANQTAPHLPFLKGVKVSSYENARMESLRAAVANHLKPGQTYINISEDAMIPLIDPVHFVSIGPYFDQWNFLTTQIVPTHYQQTMVYINKYRPIIVSRTLPYIPNYCTLSGVDYSQQFTDVHIPLEEVPVDKLHMMQKKKILSLPPTFTIPDEKKLHFVDSDDARAGLVVLIFKNAYVKQCTIAVPSQL